MFSHPALRFSVWSITAMLSLAFVGYAYSQSVPPSSSNGIKWHPGVYVNTGNYRCNPTQLADDYATIAEIGSMPNVNGIHIRTMWECLEGPTAGDYSAGFALIDEYLRRLEAAGNKRLILQLWPMGYGACTASNSSGGVYTGGIYLPAYIKNNPSMMDYCYSNQRLWSARLWQRDVMDRVIALSAAYAARYNNHPLFEMIELHEESVGMVGNTSAGFSWAAAEAQWNRMITAAKSHWTNTLVHDPVNFMQDDAMVRNQLTTHTAPGLIYGTTDTLIESVRIIPGQMAWRGLNSTGFDVPAWRDLRPGPWVSRVMWGPLYRTETPTQAHAYARDTMNASYLIWWRQTYHDGPGDGSTQWPALKTFINAGRSALTNTACPSGWTCNTTGTQPSPTPTPPSTPSGGTFSCTAPTDGGTLRLCDGFETGALNMSLWSFSGNERAQVTNTTARTGNGSVMFPLGPTDLVNFRDEIVSDNSGEFYIGGDYCIHASMKAENWSSIPDSWAAIFQTHAVPGDWSSGCIAARNSISLNVENETNTLGLKVINSSRSYPPGSSGGALASFTAYSTPFVQGRWYDFTFRYKPSFGADGILEAWHDGQQVYSQTGGNVDSTDYCGQPASPYTYLKIGLYKDRRDTGDQTVYYDNVKITEGGTCGPESFGASPSPTPSTPPPRNISVGIPVTSVASVNVRENPSVTSPIVSTQAQDSMGQVIGGPVQADGYTWWQVSWSDGTTGWSAETYLYRLTISSPVGGVVSGNNWCSVSGIAGVSPGGMCSYSRNESLLFGISRTPGDVSATQNSVSYGGSSYGGNDVLGYCGNADTFGSGRVEVILKTSGTPGPGECVISPNVDYFVNVATNIDILPLSTPQTQDEYAILFTRLPGPTQGTAPTTPTYTILPPAVTPSPVPPPPPPVSSVGGIKWHPGHYILPFVNDRDNFISYISQLSGEPNVEGMKIRLYWADLEGAEGDYRAGISLVRSYLDAAEAIGKRIILVIVPTKYGIGSTSGIVPSYLTSNPIYNGGIAVLDDRVTTRVWDPAVITRMIALADAYGAEFNTEPYFEGFEIGGETALGPVDGRVGYTNSSFDTQLRRLMTETREAFPNTNLFIHANFYKAGQALLPSLLQHAQSLDYVWAGPDILPDTGYPGNTTGNGPTDGDNALTGVLGGVDYRGNIAVGPDSQSPVYGGKDGSYLFSEIQTYSATLRANYIMWVRGIPSNLVTQFDRSDMTESAYESAVGLNALLNYIDTAPQTVQTCPRNMSCNTN